jgi:GTP-binding protein EngB required for normal cell division
LIDARLGMKQSDREMLAFLDSVKVTYQIILTKSDLVLPEDLARRASIIKRVRPTRHAISLSSFAHRDSNTPCPPPPPCFGSNVCVRVVTG